jgi:hypothetical protein
MRGLFWEGHQRHILVCPQALCQADIWVSWVVVYWDCLEHGRAEACGLSEYWEFHAILLHFSILVKHGEGFFPTPLNWEEQSWVRVSHGCDSQRRIELVVVFCSNWFRGSLGAWADL